MNHYESDLELMLDTEEYELDPLQTNESRWDEVIEELEAVGDRYRLAEKDLEMAKVEKAIEQAQMPKSQYFLSDQEISRLEDEKVIRDAISNQIDEEPSSAGDLSEGAWLLEDEWEEQEVITTKVSRWTPI